MKHSVLDKAAIERNIALTVQKAKALFGFLEGVTVKIEAAGKRVLEIVDDIWKGDERAAYNAIIRVKPLHLKMFDLLLGVGRGTVLPGLVWEECAAARCVVTLPVAEQKRLYEDKAKLDVVEVAEGQPLPTVSRKTIFELTPSECKQVFVKKSSNGYGIRSKEAQNVEVRRLSAMQKDRVSRKICWYKQVGDNIHMLAPRVVNRRNLAGLLDEIVRNTPASNITQPERDMFHTYTQYLIKR